MNPITVLLAEDHTIVREGLLVLLKLESDIQVIGQAENGRQAVKMATKLGPDVVVMDIAMPLINGLEATRLILQAMPKTKVLILSAHSDDAYVEKVMALGAAGYLVKQTASDMLVAAIREVSAGRPFFSPSISKRLYHHQRTAKAMGDLPKIDAPHLTSRELEVLRRIAEGKSNKETADDLNISIKTVEKHRQKIMEKLNVHDTASLTRYAISAGIIEISVQVTIL